MWSRVDQFAQSTQCVSTTEISVIPSFSLAPSTSLQVMTDPVPKPFYAYTGRYGTGNVEHCGLKAQHHKYLSYIMRVGCIQISDFVP